MQDNRYSENGLFKETEEPAKDNNDKRISFSSAFSGKAYFN